MKSNFLRVWKYPIVLGLLTMFGLLAALTGTGVWHVLSWIAMTAPVAACVRYGIFTRRAS